jgi:hypothetical protein
MANTSASRNQNATTWPRGAGLVVALYVIGKSGRYWPTGSLADWQPVGTFSAKPS